MSTEQEKQTCADSPREAHTPTAVQRWTVRPLDLLPIFEEDWQASRDDLAMTVVRFDDYAQQAEEIARLRVERDEARADRDFALLMKTPQEQEADWKSRAEAAESQVQALQAQLAEAQQRDADSGAG